MSGQEMSTIRTATAHVLISRQCVNDCVFCTVAERRRKGIFPEHEEVLRFISDCAVKGVKHLVFSGMGEPTLDPCFEEYLDLASELRFKSLGLFTNGYAITPEKVKRWKHRGITRVLLSLHGIGDGHDRNVRRRGSFEEAVASLELFLREDIDVSVNSCLTRLNLAEMPMLEEFLATYPLRRHTLSFPEWSGNVETFPEYMLDYQEVADAAECLVARDDGITCFVNMPFCLVQKKTLELQELVGVRLLDGKGEHYISSGSHNLFPEVCARRRCPLRGRCPGFEAKYIAARGWMDLPDRAENFLNVFAAPEDLDRVFYNRSFYSSHFSRAKNEDFQPVQDKLRKTLTVVLSTGFFPQDSADAINSAGSAAHPSASDLLMSMFDAVAEFARLSQMEELILAWHGGGRLVLNRTFFLKVLAKSLSFSDLKINNRVHINLAVLGTEWLELFRKYKVQIISPLDSIEEVISTTNDRSLYRRFIKNFLKVSSDALCVGLNLSVGPLCTKRSTDIFNVIRNIQMLSRRRIPVFLNPLRTESRAYCHDHTEWIDPGIYGSFLCEIWKCLKKDGSMLPIFPLKSLMDGRGTGCEFFVRDCERCMAVGSGGAFSCRFLSSENTVPVGNLYRENLAPLFEQNKADFLSRQKFLIEGPCSQCSFWDLCKGGCAYQAQAFYGHQFEKTPYCESYKMILAEMNLRHQKV